MSEFYQEQDTGPEWGTPQYIWKPLSETIGGFDLDPASSAEEDRIANDVFTVEDNGLEQEWYGDVWINPPYGRSFNKNWAERVNLEASRGAVETITALIPASTSTSWFHDNYSEADLFTFIDHRVKFEGEMDDNASFASLIVSFGNFDVEYMRTLNELGLVTERVY